MAEILFCGTILAAQPAEGVSPPSGPASPVEDRLEAVRKAPTDPRARLELGAAYGQAEEYDLAMAELVEAIKLNPENRGNLSTRANYHLCPRLPAVEHAGLAINAFTVA